MKVIHKLECFPTGDMVVPYCPNCNEPTYDEPNCPFCNTKLEYGDDIDLKNEIERLNSDYLEMKDNFRTANAEIERLNKELEKYKYSADELNEIERLTKQNKALNEMYELTKKEYIRLNNIIKEVREYIEEHRIQNKYSFEYDLFQRNTRVSELLEILDKENK